jgi:phage-related protein
MEEQQLIDVNESELMLTTIDNPHNPKTQYPQWKDFDSNRGYHTEEYIARLINMEEDYDVDDEVTLNRLTNKVINDILENDTLQIYRLV